jgi:hypothetical protein
MADPDPSKWRIKRDPNLPPPPNPNARTSTPNPNPLGNNPGIHNFDLSDEMFHSDGIGTDEVWKGKDENSRKNDKDFLRLLTEAYNRRADLVKQWSKYFFSLLIPSLSPYSYPSLESPLFHLETSLTNYKQTGGQPINFEGEPPKGYALFKKSDNTVHGHPSGKPYRSVKAFVDHVHAIMTETLDSCVCELCDKARAG